jgi:hypothetical protein
MQTLVWPVAVDEPVFRDTPIIKAAKKIKKNIDFWFFIYYFNKQ